MPFDCVVFKPEDVLQTLNTFSADYKSYPKLVSTYVTIWFQF